MKRTVAILLIALMALSLFAACGSKSKKTPEPDPADLVGTWVLTDVEGEGDTVELVRALLPFMETTYTFDGEGTVTVSITSDGSTQSMNAKYSVKGDQLTVDGETGKFELSGDTLRMFLEEDGYTDVYKKK